MPGPLHSLRSRVGHDNALLHRLLSTLPIPSGRNH